jgi:hypothetical protein
MPSDDKRQLGRILLQRKLVPRELQGALREESQEGPPSSSVKPILGDRDAELETLRTLADRSGVPGLDLRQLVIVLDHLDVVPREVAEALRVMPVLLRDDSLYLAMVDPHDKRAIEELEFVTGKSVQTFVAVRTTLIQTIAAAYDAKARGERRYRGSRAPE